jgi:hypothetical protein
MARPAASGAVRRNAEGVLAFNCYSPNGIYRVTVLETAGQVRVEHATNTLGDFLTAMHETTMLDAASNPWVRLWAVYVNLSIVSLLFMGASGVWLWLASRPGLAWAQWSFAAGVALFAVVWAAAR